MAKKILISPQDYYQSCYRLAKEVIDSGYRPNIIYGIHRGGATAENVMYEIFSWLGIEVKLAAAITQSYYGTEQNTEKIVKIGGYTLMPDEIWPGSKILLMEDLVDSGRSLGAIIADILDQNKDMKQEDIKVAVLDYKKMENHQFPNTIRFRRMYEPDRKKIYEMPNPFKGPDFWANIYHVNTEAENPWISYPHEVIDLNFDEIGSTMGSEVVSILKRISEKHRA
jgi:uncharacterized protein